MALIDTLKDAWWLIGILSVIIASLWRLAIRTNQSKERLEKVADNEKQIKILKSEMRDIKEDLASIKDDIPEILSALQGLVSALQDQGCNIGPVRDKLNNHLAKR